MVSVNSSQQFLVLASVRVCFKECGNIIKWYFFFIFTFLDVTPKVLVHTLIIAFLKVCTFPLESTDFLREGLALK